MTAKKKLEEKIDPSLPFAEITILGETYKMCFQFRALAKAEAGLRKQGVAANLLWQMPTLTFENIPIVFAAALGTFHPELKFEEVVDLLDYDTVFEVRDKVLDAWVAAMPKREGKAKNPPSAVPS